MTLLSNLFEAGLYLGTAISFSAVAIYFATKYRKLKEEIGHFTNFYIKVKENDDQEYFFRLDRTGHAQTNMSKKLQHRLNIFDQLHTYGINTKKLKIEYVPLPKSDSRFVNNKNKNSIVTRTRNWYRKSVNPVWYIKKVRKKFNMNIDDSFINQIETTYRLTAMEKFRQVFILEEMHAEDYNAQKGEGYGVKLVIDDKTGKPISSVFHLGDVAEKFVVSDRI